jgi:hypothetical protein
MANPAAQLVYSGLANYVALVVQGVGGQNAVNLQEWRDPTGNTVLASIDQSGNLLTPSNGSMDPTVFASSRVRMTAGRYKPTPSGTTPNHYGGPDLVAMTDTSDISLVQSPRPVIWQLHSTNVQKADAVMQNLNQVQRYNYLSSFTGIQGGSGYTSAPSVIILDGGTGATATATLSVASVTVTNGGSGYDPLNPPPVTFNLGGGTGATGTAIVDQNGQVTAVTVNTMGSGYTSPPAILFGTSPGGGSGAAAIAVMHVGALALGNLGSGYNVSPMISLQDPTGSGSGAAAAATLAVASVYIPTGGGGSGYTGGQVLAVFDPPPSAFASANAVISGGGVTMITNLSGGAGYTSPPTVSFQGGSGTGAMATAYITGDKVTNVVINQAGSGYTSAPAVVFTGPPIVSTALGTPVIVNNQLAGVNVTNPGSGYTCTPNITIGGGGLTGATAIPAMRLDNLTFYPAGTGYGAAPTVTITGNGMNATATATLSGQQVAHINVTSPGAFYITEPPIRFAGGGGSGPAATAVLGQANRTGMEINSYTMRDNGGETSALLVVSSGGANAITCYKMSETGRLPGLDNYAYSMGMAIECATADPWYAVEVGAGGFSSPHTGGCIMLRLGNATAKGLLVTPEFGTFDSRIAYAIGIPQVGQPDSSLTYWVQLNGNVNTLGTLNVGGLMLLSVQATIVPSGDMVTGLVVRGHSGMQMNNLQEWQDYSGTVLRSVGPHGSITGSLGTVTLSTASSYTLDITKGTHQKVTTASNTPTAITVNASAPGNAAQEMTFLFINTLASSLTITAGTYFKAVGGGGGNPGSVTVPASSAALLRFASDGTYWYEVSRSVINLT